MADNIIARPGGELASRPLHFFWVVDCSGSMYGEKIGIVNNTIQSVLPEMVDEAANNPNAQLFIRTLKFATGASWLTENPVKVEEYVWEDLEAGGVTDLGKAFDLLSAQLDVKQMGERALPPVVVLLTDGQPTDDYKKSLNKFQKLPWAKKAVKIAISIGQDADDDVLLEVTGNRELILQANNAKMLAKMIKWASTAISAVSSGVSSNADDSDNVPVSVDNGTTGDSGNNVNPQPKGNGPLILDMDNIPEPDDASDVW
jgi:uncharacterized protein YegL